MLHILYLINLAFTSKCDLPDGNVLSLYIPSDCQNCSDVQNSIEKIGRILHQNEFELETRIFQCDECDCTKIDIQKDPVVILSNNQEEKKRLNENISYDDIVNLIVEYFGYEKSIFDEKMQNDGEVISLYTRDFNKGLKGAWIILFYDEENENMYAYLKWLADHYKGRLNVARAHENEITWLKNRFHLYSFPVLFGFNNEVSQRFNEEYTVENLQHFCDILLSPDLPDIDYPTYIELAKTSKIPIFLAFHNNLPLVDSYFNKLARDYKFTARLFKSNDSQLIKLANVSFSTTIKKSVNPDDIVVLAIKKKNVFHKLKITSYNYEKIKEWMWHSHYPHLTKINGHNLQTVIKGIKPVVLLLTTGELYDNQLEKISENMHKGAVFAKYVFATMDTDQFTGFVEYLLPNLRIPAVVIVDPIRKIYYTKIYKWDENNFESNVYEMIDLYENDKLLPYPFKQKNNLRWLLYGGCWMHYSWFGHKICMLLQKPLIRS
ncbi:hypothetical protein EDEG_01619 [Edhazardia aedis USNM 41457]|uniref:Thioredoxin domain-containing protein n=1 Tax=Edhazardia aedis (strain USNM 41457) TaxID=1003232 RepID=J9DS31_EDHAE|nr:hypothetical protein EDEG_01619 [Edhazardia aedis USNM 41457]|eukprot:EJW04097.1 hypothetical protein EDEG_01619 [Edhazardia aedis USNM 41457]